MVQGSLAGGLSALEPIAGIDTLPVSRSAVGKVGVDPRNASPSGGNMSVSGSSANSRSSRRKKVNLNLSISANSSYTPQMRVGGVHSSTSSFPMGLAGAANTSSTALPAATGTRDHPMEGEVQQQEQA